MDWTAAIDKNREALKRVLAMLVAMAGLGTGGLGAVGQFTFFRQRGGSGRGIAQAEKSKLSPALTLPRHLHRFLLRLLRPAEAAARRLIIVAARGLVVPLRPRQPAIPRKAGRADMPPRILAPGVPPLPLLDPLTPWKVRAWRAPRGGVPRISVPGYSEPAPIHLPAADDPVDATRLALRLQALASALDDLPGQARRFARWRARRAAPQNPSPPSGEGLGVGARRRQTACPVARPRRLRPLRPGRPPGWRRKPFHEVHEILDVVHGLAFWVLESPDTS